MDALGEDRPKAGTVDLLWFAGIVIVVGGLYFATMGSWGLWEPWETEFARMGRSLATADGLWLFPVNGDGDPVNKPWLLALLLDWGYRLSHDPAGAVRLPLDALALLLAWPAFGLLRRRLGAVVGAVGAAAVVAVVVFGLRAANPSQEFWLRAPFAALGLLTVASVFAALRVFLGPHRAGLCALILASSPLFMLSALNLAGAMPLIATSTMALCAFFVGLYTTPRWPWWIVSGALTGFSVWAGGTDGAVLVLGTMACFGLWSVLRTPQRLLAPLPVLAVVLVATATLAFPAATWLGDGFEASKDVLGMFVPLGLVLTAMTAALWGDTLGRMKWSGLLLLVATMAAVTAIPMAVMLGERNFQETLSFLLYNDFLTRRTLPEHVTFDTLIRQLGFAAYPYTALLPLALAYVAQTTPGSAEPADTDSDDGGRPIGDLRVFAACWVVFGFALVGLTATLSRDYIFVALMPIALAVGMMLTDVAYWRGLRENRTILYLIGVGCLAVLLVLTKDLKTVANPEMGQLGPEVLFEFLLHDGRVEFPDSYGLPFIDAFGTFWVAAIALYFWLLLSWLDTLPDKLRHWAYPTDAADTESEGRGLRDRVTALFASLWRGVARLLLPPTAALRRLLAPLRAVVEPPSRFSALLVGSVLVFAGVSATAYMPGLSNHLSNRGLIDTYRDVAEEGEVFYRLGSSRSNVNYYLGEETIELDSGAVNQIQSLRSISDLRPHFCQPTERMFAMIDRDSLAQAYYEVRRSDSGHASRDDDDCDPNRDLWVLDARSSRYVLVTNQLREGEQNQNPIAEHIFDALPDDAIVARPQPTFDGKLRLLGYRLLNEDNEPITEASSGDTVYLETFFEVIDRPPSARQMFIHVDYRNQRINGDHQPLGGDFPINYWVPGEIVRDRYALKIDRGSATGPYTIYMGFFSGDTRMQVRPATGDNRVNLGQINIHGGI